MEINLEDVTFIIAILLLIDYYIAFFRWTEFKYYPFGLLLRFWMKILDDTEYTELELIEILKPDIIKTLESKDPYDIVRSMELSRKYNTLKEYNVRLKIVEEYQHETFRHQIN